MRAIAKSFGGFVIILFLTVHLVVVSLLMAPVPKLLAMAMSGDITYVAPDTIPEAVGDFIDLNKIEVTGDYQLGRNTFGRFLFALIRIKHDHFMDNTERLALDMNLLNYGEGVVGLNEAAEFYYKKPVKELTAQEWLTLINLQKIFSKK